MVALICKIFGHSYRSHVDNFLCRAYENYRRDHSKGNDEKKHDWLARNACNFLTESVEVMFIFIAQLEGE